MSHNEKKLKDKLEDEIKLAGLEALVPEELEKHVTLNSNRLSSNIRGRAPGNRDVCRGQVSFEDLRSNHLERANRAIHRPRVRAKERVRN